MSVSKVTRRKKIHTRIRSQISGTSSRPRLSVFRSNTGIYAQLIDDLNGVTIASATSKQVNSKATKLEQSKEVGVLLATKAREKGIEKIVFDRGGYLYHGRVKALAEGAREGGLNF